MTAEPEPPWSRLERGALETGALDPVDLALIRTLARRAEKPRDLALHTVIGCLLAAVRSGGLRIPLQPQALTARMEDFLAGIMPPQGEGPPHPTDATDPTDYAGFADLRNLAASLAREFTGNLVAGSYAAILGEPPEFKPLLHTGGGLYFQKHQAAEAAVSARLAALLSAPDSAAGPDTLGSLLDTVLRRFPLRLPPGRAGGQPETPGPAQAGPRTEDGPPAMEFDPGQQRALALALRKRFTVISGGPGTGKTSLAANLLRAWTRAWMTLSAVNAVNVQPGCAPSSPPRLPRIRLAAPTGRAAQRLAESLRRSLETVRYASTEAVPGSEVVTAGTAAPSNPADAEKAVDRFVSTLPCQTLHALLRYNPGSGEYFHHSRRPLPADLVLLDEVSMVDIFSLARLLDALEENACLVLLGDMDQLPSVEAGSVLADLVPSSVASAQSASKAVSGPAAPVGSEGGFPGSTPDHALKDNLAILDRSHRSEAGILEVTRRINAMDGAGALAALAAPMPSPAAAWPIAFLENGRAVFSGGVGGGGCRMLAPMEGRTAFGKVPAEIAGGYRRGWEAWLDSWVDFQYLAHSLDPARFPGRILAAPRRGSYEDRVAELGRFQPPEDAAFHAGLAWKGASARGDASATAPSAAFAAWLAGLDELFAYLDQARILTFTRKGWHGSESVNRRIRERLIRRWDPRASHTGSGGRDGSGGFHGCPILILENDAPKGLFNGDVGVMLRPGGRSLAFFRRAEAYLAFPAAFLPRHEPAFAMTVHKSQGSEYDQILLVLPEAGNRLLYKETLYTALTRARHFAGIYGAAEVFLEAIGRKVVRESGLPGYLGAWARSRG